MYRTCLFCSADLGANETIEEFPVGRSLAFDAERGRLWAVCRKCTRWNLAPIEERWEAVESAEKRFRDSRLRVQSENIGLCKLPDGTRLIRVGEALPGELAAWRYGDQLIGRRRQYVLIGAGSAVTGIAVFGGLAAVGVLGLGNILFQVGVHGWQYRTSRHVVYRVRASESPTGTELKLRRFQFNSARLLPDEHGVAVQLPRALPAVGSGTEPLTLRGPVARTVLGRVMVNVNHKGAKRDELAQAMNWVTKLGGAEAYLAYVGERNAGLGVPHVPDYHQYLGRFSSPIVLARRSWRSVTGSFRGEIDPIRKLPPWKRQGPLSGLLLPDLSQTESLALEMALHEESERRALEGELAALEAAWREAEEIARIADVLPDDPLKQLSDRPGNP